MNHVYRTVFNRARGIYQVASEITPSAGRGGRQASAVRAGGADLIGALPSAVQQAVAQLAAACRAAWPTRACAVAAGASIPVGAALLAATLAVATSSAWAAGGAGGQSTNGAAIGGTSGNPAGGAGATATVTSKGTKYTVGGGGGGGSFDSTTGASAAGGKGGGNASGAGGGPGSGTVTTVGSTGTSAASLTGAAGTAGSVASVAVGGYVDGGGGGGASGVAGLLTTAGTRTIDANITGGAGGAGGGAGGTGSGWGGGGGGGEGGAAILRTGGDLLINTSRTVRGGAGGAGGKAGTDGSPKGGNGGDGGVGMWWSGAAGTLTNSGTVIGGTGGVGGTGLGGAGASGAGGAGVQASGATIVNGGAMSGGNGGAAATGGVAGAGGVGISGSNLNVTNSGSITGGKASAGSGAQANAITFTGGNNILQINTGSTITGNVVGATGAGTNDLLRLGGTTAGTFNVSNIGGPTAQYQNFDSFEKLGSGTWTLSGSTTAVTPWTVSAGTLAIGADGNLGATSGALTLNGGTLNTTATMSSSRLVQLGSNGGTLSTDGATTLTLSGVVSGSGSLVKQGAGTAIFTGANSYTGGTTVSAGTLALSGAGNLVSTGAVALTGSGAKFDISAAGGNRAIGALSGVAGSTVALGARTLTFGDGTNQTFAGAIGGTGGIVKRGTGIATLSGINTYIGGTEVQAGTLALSGAGSLASTGAVVLSGLGATLDISAASADITIGGLIGAGGGTSVALGARMLTFGDGTNQTIAGVIGGAGGIVKQGTGTATLTGVNTYTGGTTVSAGTLALSGAGNLVSTGAVALTGSGAKFDISAAGGNRAIGALSGAAGSTVALGASNLTFGDGTNQTFAGAIGGTTGGIVKQGTGTTTLTGTNTYTGGTFITAGTLALSGTGSLANAGAVTLNGGGAGFDISAASGDRTIGALSGAAGSTVALGANTLTFGDATSQTFAGGINGTGGIVKQGSGTTSVSGPNTYSGTTTVAAGTLSTTGVNTLSSQSAMTVGAGATLQLNGLNQTIGSLAGAGAVVAGSATLTTGGNNTSTTYSGPLTGGQLVKVGTGTMTLTGANSQDGTTLNAGTLAVANNGNLGSINASLTFNGAAADSATLQLLGNGQNFTHAMVLNGAGGTIDANDTTNGTISGVISGGGALHLVNNGSSGAEVNRITLSGANTYDGGTTIAGNAATGGRMQVVATTSGALGTGAVSMGTNAQLEFNGAGVSAGNLSIAVPTSTGSLGSNSGVNMANGADAGTATITLGAPGAYLDIGSGASAAASTIVNNGGRVYFHNTTSGGSAQLTNNGGLVSVTGAVDLSGTTVTNNAGGRLYVNGLTRVGAIGELSGAGDVVLGSSSLSIGGLGTSTTISGVISDTASTFPYADDVTATGGRILKTGSGKLTLSGANTYTGGTTVDGGTLAVNGSVMGDVQVNNSGTLAGSGSIGGNVAVASGATLSAGNSPGTLTVAGDLTLSAGSTSVFELDQSGAVGGTSNDLVNVGGNLTLGGALQATASSAGWYRLFNYGVSNSAATLTGSFDSTNVTGSAGFDAASHQVSTTAVAGSTPGQVNLSVLGTGQSLQFWNGSTTAPGGSVVGGNGTWDGFASNWTDETGSTAGNWLGSVGVFAGAPGTVTVQGPQSFDTLQFTTDGYSLVAGTDGTLGLAPATGTRATINTDAGIGASIAAPIVNGGGTSTGTTLRKVGNGTLTLSGANTYTGGTEINEGTLIAASNSALGTGEAIVDNSLGHGATLQVNTGVSLTNVLITLDNGGTLVNAGSIVRDAAGQVAVRSTNGGATVHNTGGTLSATGTGGTGVFIDGTGTTVASGVVNNTLGGQIKADAFGVQIRGVGSVTNNASTISAAGSDGRGVEIGMGTGTVVNQANGIIEGGMFGVALFSGGSVSNTDSTIRATGTDPLAAGVIIGGGAGTVTNTGADSLIQGAAAGVRLVDGGSITNGAGATISGALAVHAVDGSTTLSNAGTLLGNVQLASAAQNQVTLVSGGSIVGNLDIGTNAASTLTLEATADQVHSSAVSGTTTFAGGLVKTGAATWVLDRDLAPASTTISAGTLQLGNGGTTGSLGGGAITNNATLAVNRSDSVTLANAIDGSGNLVKQGANTLTLTGASSYTGGTALLQGRIDVGHNSALGTGELAMDNGTTLGFAANGLNIANAIRMTGNEDPVVDTGSFNETLSGVISGGGFLTKEGTGALTLTGDNTYTGITTISAGTLQIGDGGTTGTLGSGAVTNNGALVFMRSDALTVANGIDGSGSLTQAGSGTLTLGGTNTYTGATLVDAGTLRAGAANSFSAASAHTVAAGATLDLAGFSQTVAGVTNAGTVSLRGSTPGTVLTVTGPWVGQGGTLALGTALADNASVSDKLLLSGTSAVASGTTNLRVTNLGGLGGLTTGEGIALVGTENGASIQGNAFSLAAPVAAGAYEYRLNTTTDGAYLSSASAAPAPAPAPGPGPSPAPAPAPAPSGTPLYRTEVPLLAALPEQLRQANLAMLGNMHQRMGDDGAGAAGNPAGERQAWGRILTVDRSLQQGGTVSPSSEGRLTGFQAGTDLWATPAWRAGVYVGQLEGDMKVSGFARGIAGYAAGRNDLKNEYLGGYLTYKTDSGFYADGVLQAGRHRTAMSTTVSGPAGSNKGSSLLASIEVGQAFALGAGWSLEPQLQLVHQRLNLQDTGLVGATVQQDTHNGWAVRAGLRVKGEFAVGSGTLQPYARLNVWHTSSGTDRARFIGPAAFTDILTPTGGTSTEAALGANWQISPAVGVYGELGQLWASGGSTRTKGGPNASLGVKVRW